MPTRRRGFWDSDGWDCYPWTACLYTLKESPQSSAKNRKEHSSEKQTKYTKLPNRQTVGWKQEGALTWRCQPLLSLPRPVRTTIAVREDGILREIPNSRNRFANDVGYFLFLHLCHLCFVLPCIQYHLPTQPVPRNHAQQLGVCKFAFFCSCVPFGVQVVKNVR